MRNSSVVFVSKTNSNLKVFSYKVVQLLKFYNFYFFHLFIWHSGSNVVYNFIYLSSSFMKLYERDVHFVNNVTTALSNEEIIKIKIVYLNWFTTSKYALKLSFAECFLSSTWQSSFCQVSFFPALGKELVCRVLNFRHSVSNLGQRDCL